jgi:hypothetical protein
VDEDVAAPNFAQEDALGGIIQELRVTPWCGAVVDEQETKNEMLKIRQPAIIKPKNQPAAQPDEQPDAQPSEQPADQPEDQPAAQPEDQCQPGRSMYTLIWSGLRFDLATGQPVAQYTD